MTLREAWIAVAERVDVESPYICWAIAEAPALTERQRESMRKVVMADLDGRYLANLAIPREDRARGDMRCKRARVLYCLIQAARCTR